MNYQEQRSAELDSIRKSAQLTSEMHSNDPYNEIGDSPTYEDVSFEQRLYEQALYEYERDFH